MPRRLPLLALLLLAAATACAADDPLPADAAATDAATGAATSELPVTPPRMAVEPPPRRIPGGGEDMARCDADAARGAIGKEATAEVVEQARRDAGAAVVRTLSPGQMVTMEYHASRLNLDVDEANVVIGVRCG